MRREDDLDIGCGGTRKRLRDFGRMAMRQAVEANRFVGIAEVRLGRRLATGSRNAGERGNGDGSFSLEARFHDGKGRQGRRRGIAARAGHDGRDGLELVTCDLGQTVHGLGEQVDARMGSASYHAS